MPLLMMIKTKITFFDKIKIGRSIVRPIIPIKITFFRPILSAKLPPIRFPMIPDPAKIARAMAPAVFD